MFNYKPCPWCHSEQFVWEQRECYCGQCGHRSDRAKENCNCPECLITRAPLGQEQPVEPAPQTRVHGRHLKAPVVDWHISDAGVTLKVDDEHNAEEWVTAHINFAQLTHLVAKVMEVREQQAYFNEHVDPDATPDPHP